MRVRVDAFSYELPEELIAQTPLSTRSDSRLLVVDPVTGNMTHDTFVNIGSYLQSGDVVVLNNSKVIPARLFARKTDTGAHIELLLTRPTPTGEWQAMVKPAKRLQVGSQIEFEWPQNGLDTENVHQNEEHKPRAEVTAVLPDGLRQFRFDLPTSLEAFLDAYGTMPLPPYIHEKLSDQGRYQTVYAQSPGSVAAPTAGLHFTADLLSSLQARGVEVRAVTLHVGLGTFRPVQVEDVEAHVMHHEWYEVPVETAEAVNEAKRTGRRVIAVGTTALRTLESAGQGGLLQAGQGETDIFMFPGYEFQIADALITNFHLPKSTLVMLVAAWLGDPLWRQVYETAVQARYRFFSFGDAMMITGRGIRH